MLHESSDHVDVGGLLVVAAEFLEPEVCGVDHQLGGSDCDKLLVWSQLCYLESSGSMRLKASTNEVILLCRSIKSQLALLKMDDSRRAKPRASPSQLPTHSQIHPAAWIAAPSNMQRQTHPSNLLLNNLHRRTHPRKLALPLLRAQMPLKRVRVAAPYTTRRDPVQRDRGRSFRFVVDARKVFKVLVLWSGSTFRSVDGFAMESGGIGGRCRAGLVTLWGC